MSQKIRLVLQKSYVENPTFKDTLNHSLEVELPDGWDQAHILAARSYQPKSASSVLGGDINTTVMTYSDESDIIGKILTLADMSFTDKEQREAFKAVARQTLYDKFNAMRRNAVKCVDAQERNEQEQAPSTKPE